MVWSTKTQQPTVRQVYVAPPGGNSGFLSTSPDQDGFNLCGICRCCTCIHLGFLRTPTAVLKMIEFLVGLVCQLLLLKYGMKYGNDLGLGYFLFLTTTSASLITSTVLLLTYLVSNNTYSRVRPSLFEVVFNVLCCCLYMTASSFLATAVLKQLYYFYQTVPGFSVYPAMTACYVLGYIVGICHGVDGLMALKFMRSTRS